MVPVQTLPLEENVGNDGEDDEGNAFLYHLELDQRERPAVADEADAVGWHLAAVLEEGYRPAEDYHTSQGPVAADASLLQFEVSIPCYGHENVA